MPFLPERIELKKKINILIPSLLWNWKENAEVDFSRCNLYDILNLHRVRVFYFGQSQPESHSRRYTLTQRLFKKYW